MSLCFTRPDFFLCSTCAGKPGSPVLCIECLERRELWSLAERFRKKGKKSAQICPSCKGYPHPECKEHGR